MHNQLHAPRLLLLGYGNVARSFLPLLASRHSWLEQELGITPLISGIGSRRTGFFTHPTGISPTESDLMHSIMAIGNISEDAETFIQAGRAAGANVLIELTTLNPENGEPALSSIRQALTAGMDVITANKGPIAHAAHELHTLAHQQNVYLRYESTVMDGLPLLNLAQFTLPAVDIRGFRGLLNSTSSIVLSQMEQGVSLDDAIRLAQQIGVAEADPWHDLDGWDAAMKTTILANALLNAHLTPRMVQRTGIRDLSQDEVISAAQAGTPIRLVSSMQVTNGSIVATVRPERLQADDTLYSGKDIGIISLETEAMGIMTLTEHATGVLQTAYGVLSDLIVIQRVRHKN
ncbi:MAG: homoserine dehydrogenase [Ktedonobacteraceae bacterium]